jgi:hypothetical protein
VFVPENLHHVFRSKTQWSYSGTHGARRAGWCHEFREVILSTHSPVLAAFPDAAIHEVEEWALRRSEWADLDLVRNLKLGQ